jgi:hypothetical protein
MGWDGIVDDSRSIYDILEKWVNPCGMGTVF